MTAESPETNPDTDSREGLQQKAERVETTQKPSILAGVIASIVWLLLLAVIPSYLMVETIPKLKVILTDMLGPGETLPQSTLLVLQISDAVKNNLIVCLIIGCIPGIVLLYFMGFKERYINPTLCKIIDVSSIALYAGTLFYIFTAMLMPFQQYTQEEWKKMEAHRRLAAADQEIEIHEPGSKPWHQLKFLQAVRNGNLAEVKYYIETDLDINEPFEGTSALHVAIESRYIGREEIVTLLLDNGADVNATNSREWTPAESLKRTEGAMMLIGARVEVKEANKKIADLLVKHGAKTDPDFKSSFPDKKVE